MTFVVVRQHLPLCRLTLFCQQRTWNLLALVVAAEIPIVPVVVIVPPVIGDEVAILVTVPEPPPPVVLIFSFPV